MTETWKGWCERVATVCGVPEKESAMLAEWSGLLAAEGHTAAEAAEATDWVAVNDPQKWRPDLLGAIVRRLKAMKAPKAPEAVACPENQSCAICGGVDAEGFAKEATGRVYVPDPDRLRERKVVVVYCRCPLGRYFRAAKPNVKLRGVECRVLTVDDIAERFEGIHPAPWKEPGWRGYLEWWAESARKTAAGLDNAERADREGGPLRPTPRTAREIAEAWVGRSRREDAK